jgi:rhodanese-related sulfurtransferase
MDFPYRDDYPGVPVIELADLKAAYDRHGIIIVDVRSSVEFETIHILAAQHIPMSLTTFEIDITKLARDNPGMKIALYCNGGNSIKSYHAVQRAMEVAVTDVYSFDAGIGAWADTYPEETFLLGRKITDPERQLIPTNDFAALCLDYSTFKQRAAEKGTVVIDARDTIQKTQELPGLQDVKHIPLDKFISNVVNRGVLKNKTLLIFDQAGQQVQWLMYHLAGYNRFYFLQGGATSVLHHQEYRKNIFLSGIERQKAAPRHVSELTAETSRGDS